MKIADALDHINIGIYHLYNILTKHMKLERRGMCPKGHVTLYRLASLLLAGREHMMTTSSFMRTHQQINEIPCHI